MLILLLVSHTKLFFNLVILQLFQYVFSIIKRKLIYILGHIEVNINIYTEIQMLNEYLRNLVSRSLNLVFTTNFSIKLYSYNEKYSTIIILLYVF